VLTNQPFHMGGECRQAWNGVVLWSESLDLSLNFIQILLQFSFSPPCICDVLLDLGK